MAVEEPVTQYDGLTREQLIQILEKRERTKKLGLVWERNEIEADKAVDANFVACTLDLKLCERTAPWSNLVIEGDNFDALRWLRIGSRDGSTASISILPTTPGIRIGSTTITISIRTIGTVIQHGSNSSFAGFPWPAICCRKRVLFLFRSMMRIGRVSNCLPMKLFQECVSAPSYGGRRFIERRRT